MPTIYDIAAKAGVSATTVSQCLNNKGAISAEVRDHILQTAKELKYVPNAAARSLKTKRTNNVLLGLNYYRDQFYFDFIKGVKEVLEANGFNLILTYTDDSAKKEIGLFDRLAENIFDALILVTITNNTSFISRLNEFHCPVTLSSIENNHFDLSGMTVDYVGVDTYFGILKTMEHLIEFGYRKIGYVGLPMAHIDVHKERYDAYVDAMNKAGLPIEPQYVFTGGYTEEFGYSCGRKMIENDDLPRAICCSTDIAAFGVFRALREAGIVIPDQVALTGMDNLDIDVLIQPELTSVNLKQYLIGKMAAEFICSRLKGYTGESRNLVFTPELIVRHSSKAANVKTHESTACMTLASSSP